MTSRSIAERHSHMPYSLTSDIWIPGQPQSFRGIGSGKALLALLSKGRRAQYARLRFSSPDFSNITQPLIAALTSVFVSFGITVSSL